MIPLARIPKTKQLVGTRLLKDYASWVYCGNCNNTVAYLCYVTYDAFDFACTCNCGAHGKVKIEFEHSAPAASTAPLDMIKNRLCCPADHSPLVTIVEKNVTDYQFRIVCGACNTEYSGRKNAAAHSGTLILRPFCDDDIPLMERWLYAPHVAKWYRHPEHWLRELRERHGEFSFLHHFIAEVDGAPIGFCQYYDTHFAQEHEVWNDEWHVGERQGEVFSLDYLIGEAAYLRRGFGKGMVRLMLQKLRAAGAKQVIVQPEAENAASNRTLEASGFVCSGQEYVLVLRK